MADFKLRLPSGKAGNPVVTDKGIGANQTKSPEFSEARKIGSQTVYMTPQGAAWLDAHKNSQISIERDSKFMDTVMSILNGENAFPDSKPKGLGALEETTMIIEENAPGVLLTGKFVKGSATLKQERAAFEDAVAGLQRQHGIKEFVSAVEQNGNAVLVRILAARVGAVKAAQAAGGWGAKAR